MTRPVRHIDDHAGVVTDTATHFPQRPFWTCDADGEEWPCEALRTHLLATMTQLEISVAMGAHYLDAVREIDAPAAKVHSRLFGWFRTGQ